MPDPRQFEALRLELLRGGAAPVYVERTVLELLEHYTDLESDARAAGLDAAAAEQRACEQLGEHRAIAAAVLARPELQAWDKRWPRFATCVHSATAIGAIPGLPLVYCFEHRPELARWCASFSLATAFVGGVACLLEWLMFAV
jgi:hypothetical protein